MEKLNKTEGTAERRFNMIVRKKFNDLAAVPRYRNLTRKELFRMCFSDAVTGLPNLRVWQETANDDWGPEEMMAALDVDGLKWVNDHWGYAAGDGLLRATARGLQEAGLKEVYHIHGDEFFLFLPDGMQIALLGLIAAKKVAEQTFSWVDSNGHKFTAQGATFSYGVGDSEPVAIKHLHRVKDMRLAQGSRADRADKPTGLCLIGCSTNGCSDPFIRRSPDRSAWMEA